MPKYEDVLQYPEGVRSMCVRFSGHSDLQSHARYSERVRVQGAMLWHSMSQLCAHYVQHYVLQ